MILINKERDTNVLSNQSSKLRVANTNVVSVFQRIQSELLEEDLKRFQICLDKALEPQNQYLTDTEKKLYMGGKKIRPMMIMLSARMVWGTNELPDKVIKAAVSLEMLHVASLIHDDIIDGAIMRRGLKSVNATRGTNTAILVGDLQFLQAIRSFIDAINSDTEMELVKMVLDTAFNIICGEIDELEINPFWNPKKLRDHYFEVIERKTAILFGLACESGMALASARSRDSRRIGFYGRRLGRSFQIMDDLFDNLLDTGEAGKVRGTDLAQKRFSLPLIYALEELGEKHMVSRILHGELEADSEQLAKAVEDVKLSNGFALAYADARYEALSALEFLKPFKENRYKKALEDIALAIIDRNH